MMKFVATKEGLDYPYGYPLSKDCYYILVEAGKWRHGIPEYMVYTKGTNVFLNQVHFDKRHMKVMEVSEFIDIYGGKI